MPDPLRKLVAGVLMSLGGLIAGLCGLCTGGLALFGLFGAVLGLIDSSRSAGPGIGLSLIALTIGAVPIAIGAGLFLAERRLWRG